MYVNIIITAILHIPLLYQDPVNVHREASNGPARTIPQRPRTLAIIIEIVLLGKHLCSNILRNVNILRLELHPSLGSLIEVFFSQAYLVFDCFGNKIIQYLTELTLLEYSIRMMYNNSH